jgi:hypothetical protein
MRWPSGFDLWKKRRVALPLQKANPIIHHEIKDSIKRHSSPICTSPFPQGSSPIHYRGSGMSNAFRLQLNNYGIGASQSSLQGRRLKGRC